MTFRSLPATALRATLFAAALAFVATGCSGAEDSPDAGTPVVDAGLDAGTDAGTTDAGPTDAGSDAGELDAGTDAGTTDAGDSDAGTDAGTPIAADELAERFIAAYCTLLERCGDGEERPIDQATCITLVTSSGFGDESTFNTPAAIEAEVVGGKATINQTELAACFDDIATAACDDGLFEGGLDTIASCRAALTGLVALGSRCIASEACVAGAYCSRTAGSACDGTCTPIGTGRCNGSEDCGTGKVCRYGPENSSACITLGALGTPCSSSETCQAGLDCQPVAGGGQQCLPLPGNGLSCTERCAEGLYCSRETGSPVCRPLPAAASADCSVSRDCAGGLTCIDARPPATCVGFPTANQPCSEFGQCAANHWCDQSASPRICRANVPLHGDCSQHSSHCATGLTCVSAGGTGPTCEPYLTLGSDCSVGACAPGTVCSGDGESTPTCLAPPPAGQPCLSGHCAANAFCNSMGGQPLCQAKGTAGADCVISPCAEGFTCQNTQFAALRCVAYVNMFGACGNGEPCSPGLTCLHDGNGSSTCHPLPHAGGNCAFTRQCLDATCVETEAGPENIQCQPSGGAGQPCRQGECNPGHVCETDVEGGPTCLALPGLDAACNLDRGQPCADPSHVCTIKGAVTACVPGRKAGESCATLLECGGLLSPLICDLGATGLCVRRPPVASPCRVVAFDSAAVGVCDPSVAWCNDSAPVQSNWTCEAFKADGVACTDDEQCGGVFHLGECRSAGGDLFACDRQTALECTP